MISSSIIAKARKLTYSNTSQYSDTDGLDDLNILYKKLISYINQEGNTDLFSDIFWGTMNPWQVAYTKPQTNNATKIAGMNNMLGVFVNYNVPVLQTGTISTTTTSATGVGTTFTQNFGKGDNLIIGTALYMVVNVNSATQMDITLINNDTGIYSGYAFYKQTNNFVKARPERSSNLAKDADSYYRFYQPQSDPFYIIYDTEVCIYPAVSTTTQFGFKIKATKDVPDLTLTDTPILDDNYHFLLAFWLREFIYLNKGSLTEASNAKIEYDSEVEKSLGVIGDLTLEPYVYLLANTNWLQ